MDAVSKDVRRLVNKELEAANRKFRQFASPHEGYAVIVEELNEVWTAEKNLRVEAGAHIWNLIKANRTVPRDDLRAVQKAAIDLAVEAIQVAAMAKKFEHSQRNNWPGAKENCNGEENNTGRNRNGDSHNEPRNSGSGSSGL